MTLVIPPSCSYLIHCLPRFGGHGPWSHVFDVSLHAHPTYHASNGQIGALHAQVSVLILNSFTPLSFDYRVGCDWTHEEGSVLMFDDLVNEKGIELADADARFIKALILGNPNLCAR